MTDTSIFPIKKDPTITRNIVIQFVVIFFIEFLLSVYATLRIIEKIPMSVGFFSVIILFLVAINTMQFVYAYKKREYIGARLGVTLIAMLGLVYGYWVFAPVLYFLALNLNEAQFSTGALTFLWEVPIFGWGYSFLLIYLFGPVARFLESESKTVTTDDVNRIYARLRWFPIFVGSSLLVFGISGYYVGGIQQGVIAHLAPIERTKNILTGTVTSLFVVMTILYFHDWFFNMIRSAIKLRFPSVINTANTFKIKVFFTIIAVAISVLGISTTLDIKTSQDLLREMLAEDALGNFDVLFDHLSLENPMTFPVEEKSLRTEDRSAAVIVGTEQYGKIPKSSTVENFIINNKSGAIDDYQYYEKVFVFKTNETTGEKQVLVAQLLNSFSSIKAIVRQKIYYVVSVLLSFLSIAYFFSFLITDPITKLSKSIKRRVPGGASDVHQITTGDEFEDLSQAIIDYSDDLSNEKAKLTASINSLVTGFIIADTEEKIILLNPVLLKILNIKETPTSLGELARVLKEQSTSELSCDIAECARSCIENKQSIQKDEVVYGSKFLKIFFAPVTSTVSHAEQEVEKQIIGCVVLIEDITEAKIMQRSRDEFFAVASHELRTPLTAVRGNSEMILDSYLDKIDSDDVKEMLTDIHKASIHVIDIVNDFLEVSRLEQGKVKMVPEVVDVREIIGKVVRNLTAVAEKNGIALSYTASSQEALIVFVDPGKLEQVIINLVGNAIKFTTKGSVTITTTLGSGFIEVAVTDTGIGISEKGKVLLFRKFQQASDTSLVRDVSQSTGLGLYICKLIVTNMGGLIYLKSSEPGKGSTFAITIPVAEGDPAATAST